MLHRWDFQGFESVDAAATRKAVRTLSPYTSRVSVDETLMGQHCDQ